VHPKYIRALLLLSLIYLKHCEYEKARRCLVRIQKMDVGNVTALRYLEEIKQQIQSGTQGAEQEKEGENFSSGPQFVPVHSYKEDKPNFLAFLTFFLGIVIGVAVIYYMAVPNIRQSIKEEYNAKEKNYSAMLSLKESEISTLESKMRIQENTVNDLNSRILLLEDYEPLINALYRYHKYVQNETPTMEETDALLEEIYAIDMQIIAAENAGAAELYETMKEDMEERAGIVYLQEGLKMYDGGNPEKAFSVFGQALIMLDVTGAGSSDLNYSEVLYRLGRFYHEKEDISQAKQLYERLLTECPDCTYVPQVSTYLEEIAAQEAAALPTTNPEEIPEETPGTSETPTE